MSRSAFVFAWTAALVIALSWTDTPVRAEEILGSPPTYSQTTRPYTADVLQDHDFRYFQNYNARVFALVSLAELQSYLDQIEPGRFVALASADEPALALVLISVALDRVFQFEGLPPVGPVSRLGVFAYMFDTVAGRVELAGLAVYATDPTPINEVFGSPVALPACITPVTLQTSRRTRIALRVAGEDEFVCKLSLSVSPSMGTESRSDPNLDPLQSPLVTRLLGDGPGGVHPVFHFGSETRTIPALEGGVRVSGELVLPYGTVQIVEVLSGDLQRWTEALLAIVD